MQRQSNPNDNNTFLNYLILQSVSALNIITLNILQSFHELSYKKHEDHFRIEDNQLTDLQKSWFRNDTVGYWRFSRTFQPLIPLINNDPKARWLTVGDGRFGLDAIELKHISPSLHVLPTDISPALLKYSKNQGWIDDFSVENAESLSFENDSFDYVLCRESYHHFPRPAIALYEMLRVARKAVILVEPNDHAHPPFFVMLFNLFRNTIKKAIKRPIYPLDRWAYEESGNYIYSLSKRELEKIALGLNLPAVATKHYNDYYEAGTEFEPLNAKSPLCKKVKNKIAIADLKCRLGISHFSNIIGIIFKEMPEKGLADQLKKAGLLVNQLSRNPYIKR